MGEENNYNMDNTDEGSAEEHGDRNQGQGHWSGANYVDDRQMSRRVTP